MLLPELAQETDGTTLHTLDPEAWLVEFLRITGSTAPDQDNHLRMLQKIAGPRACAIDGPDDDPVCCGLGVLHGKKLGLFDLATTATQRRQGWATTLCRKLLAWGMAAGAQSAYLQVVGSNINAIALYEKLGFRKAYSYWYRVAG